MSYRYMRLLLMFDMPTSSPTDRRNYRDFRKFLISEGFIMHQFSVYTKILLNATAAQAMVKRLEKKAPKTGYVTVLVVTEKQFSKMIYLQGERDTRIANTDNRLVFLGGEDDG